MTETAHGPHAARTGSLAKGSHRRLAAVVGAAVVAGVVVAVASAGLVARLGNPPPEQKLCVAPAPVNGVQREGTPEHRDALCGSRGNDRLKTVGGNDHVWAFDGDDVILARNGLSDEIWGGRGHDRGEFDVCDTVRNVEVKVVRGDCKGVRSAAASLAAADPWYGSAVVECWVSAEGERSISFLREPQMLALDVTRKVDYQTVAWQAIVVRHNGTEWEYYDEGSWFWDRVPDSSVDAFPGNFWRSFKTRQRVFVEYALPERGVYSVVINYHWYKTDVAPERTELHEARAHYGPAAQPEHGACEFTA